MKKFLLALFVLFAFAQSQQNPSIKSFTDTKTGKKYKIFDTENLAWFIQDLGNYSWDAAMKSCPADWRLPTNEEWKSVEIFFAAHPALWEEFRKSARNKEKIEKKTGFGFWWSATEAEPGTAYFQFMYEGYNDMYEGYDPKDVKHAVRCVKE
ncbi:MAG: hypothetical protein LBB36_04580 [Fibromonadaceae bacterium]|jgi:hypothetical protein|nr:hypothetical protein [Fibromonadaceae bacterium]